ncbi:acyltransferase [Budvicia aquatica]|uniref:Acyltransferase n=1 Tax=Budvicia aquatica TaxID=82979 RepID=A0A2C6C652_9GAMM|nr:acyltransferase [Budvicia aquatica]PHI31820.1 acyltransferase [Budvicia aquatica]VFS52820.1 putative acyl transferase [Budvicia aquatica]
MTGRRFFELFSPIIKFFVLFLRFFPRFFLLALYDFFSLVPTRIGVLARYILVSAQVKSIGKNVYIGRFVTIKNMYKLSIGDNVSIHEYSYLDACGNIYIGSEVSIAHGVSIISFEHSWKDSLKSIKYNNIIFKDIIINDDVWIGAGARILGGSILEHRTVVGSGSVFKLCGMKNSIYAGVPARKIGEI